MSQKKPRIIVCPRCDGTGKIKEPQDPISGVYKTRTCPICQGTGRVREVIE